MIIKKYPAPPIETSASRYDRDWLNIPDLDTAGEDDYRHDRTLLQQDLRRKSRRYVDDGVSAVTGGAPVFDPDESGEDGGDSLESLWTDNFDGDSLDARWNITEGDALLNPLRPNKDVESSIGLYTGPEDYSRIDIVFDDSTTFGMTLMDESLTGMYALIEQFQENLVANRGDNIISIPMAPGEVRELSLIINENSLRMIANGIVSDELVTPLSTPLAILINLGGSIRSISTYGPEDNGGGTPLPEGTVWSDNFSEETLGELWSQLIGAPLKTNPLRSSDRKQAMIASEPTLANRIETEAFFGQDEAAQEFGITINSAQGAPIASIWVESNGSIGVESSSGQDSLNIGDLTDKKARISVEFDQDAIRVFVDSALALTHADDSIPDGPYMLALSIEGGIEVLYFRAILNDGGGTPEPEVPEGSYQENYTETY